MTAPELVFGCHSRRHARCTEVIIDGVFCHFGRLDALSQYISRQARQLGDSSIATTSFQALPPYLRVHTVFESSALSQLKICSILSEALNDRRIMELPDHLAIYAVPGTLDIIIMNAQRLALQIKETIDSTYRYYPNKVEGLRALELGYISLREIAKLALKSGFQLSVPDEDVVVEEDLSTQSSRTGSEFEPS